MPLLIEMFVADEGSSCCRSLARLHRETIPGGFLSSLGEPFLEVLYTAISRSPNAAIYIARLARDGEVIGYICGAINTATVSTFVLRTSGLRLCLRAFPRAFSLAVIRKCFETFWISTGEIEGLPEPSAEILNFSVSASARGAGIGRALFGTLMEHWRRLGVSTVKIVTGANQDEALRFYRAAKAREVGDFELHRGVASRLFYYDLPPIQNETNH